MQLTYFSSQNLLTGLPHPGKSLNFVYKSWKVLENIWGGFPCFIGTE